MPSAATLRSQIEASLAHRIPAALTPRPRVLRLLFPTGISEIDGLLEGGIPVGAITEVSGAPGSGRTSFALSLLAGISREKVCAWIDVSNEFDPESAAANGVNLSHLLWVRCGAAIPTQPSSPPAFALPAEYLVPPPPAKGLHGGGCGRHPRQEAKGLSAAVGQLLGSPAAPPQQPKPAKKLCLIHSRQARAENGQTAPSSRGPWKQLEQALRAADLLLHGGGFGKGGFGAVIFDMGSILPKQALRVPMATWFRYRAATEHAQTCFVLLTQQPCAKSSAELLLRLHGGESLRGMTTVLTGIGRRVEVVRRRFADSAEKPFPPQRAVAADWQSRASWAGQR